MCAWYITITLIVIHGVVFCMKFSILFNITRTPRALHLNVKTFVKSGRNFLSKDCEPNPLGVTSFLNRFNKLNRADAMTHKIATLTGTVQLSA